jgi:hypothetical protein
MSDMSSSGTEKPSSPKKQVSSARNAIGVIVLVIVAGAGWFEYSAKSGYNAAVTALDKETQDEVKGFLGGQEAERLIGKAPDDAGSDFQDGSRTFTKKTYTWRGLLKPYTLTAFYTKEKDVHLHHFETDAKKLPPEPVAPAPVSTVSQAPGGEFPKPAANGPPGGRGRRGGEPKHAPEASKPTATPAQAPATTSKAPETSKPTETPAPVSPATPKAAQESKPAATPAPVPPETPK